MAAKRVKHFFTSLLHLTKMDFTLRHISIDDRAAIEAEFASITEDIVAHPEAYYETPSLLVWDARLSQRERTRALKSWRCSEEQRLRRDGDGNRLARLEAINQALVMLRTEGVQCKSTPGALAPKTGSAP